jgi:hypothetical protein
MPTDDPAADLGDRFDDNAGREDGPAHPANDEEKPQEQLSVVALH